MDNQAFIDKLQTIVDGRIAVLSDTSLTDDEKRVKLSLFDKENDELNQSIDIYFRLIDAKGFAQYSELMAQKADITALDAKADKTALDAKADKTALDAKADKTALDAKADKTALDAKADKTALDAKADKTALDAKADKTALDAKADKTALDAKADKTALDAKADKTALDAKADKTALDAKADKTALAKKADKAALAKKADKVYVDNGLDTKLNKSGYDRMPMGISWWTVPNAVAPADETKLVRSFQLQPKVSGGLRLFFSGFATVQSKSGSDVGGQVYIKVDGHLINGNVKFTLDRWGGAGDGHFRIPIPFGGDIEFSNRSGNSPLTIEIYIEAANSEFALVNGQGRLHILEAPYA